MQMPLGILADRLGGGKWFAAAGCILVALVCSLPSFGLVPVMILGLGNGLFHIGGGYDILSRSGNRAAPLGIFVSPGALGLYCGTLLGKTGFPQFPVAGLLLICAGSILLLCKHITGIVSAKKKSIRSLIPLGAALFLVVVLRSFAGMQSSFPWKTDLWSWPAVLAVVLGKTAGGFLCDRFGAKSIVFASLGGAAISFLFSSHAVPGLAALLLFNITMPITLWALANVMPAQKGFSFGLLTFGLFLGFLPSYLGTPPVTGTVLTAVCIISAALLSGLPGRKEAVHD
jgi:FSR family fosmidomycin resistance protein-like MFS transporter